MPRKDNRNNPLQIRVRALSLPKGVKPKDYLQRLVEHMDDGRPLPSSWDVEIGWRNPGTKHGVTKRWRYDDFESAVSDSRAGFNGLLRDVLVRQLRRMAR